MMQSDIKKWIWQHEDYPHFRYDKKVLSDALAEIEYNRGLLDGVSKLFNESDIKNIEVETLLHEAINTSEIEGEYFKRESVRSSLLKKLDSSFDALKDSSTHKSDALVEILIDCSTNHEPLNIERLHGWHNCLFITGYDKLHKINIASFRMDDDMKVVSGAIGHEKIHYLAPPQNKIIDDINHLLSWCKQSDENIYIKSAIAHLWFVIVHPYDDGNGRIARAITDYILSQNQSPKKGFKLYSMSMAINSDRKGYYAILDKTTNLFYNREFDITSWIKWHLDTLNHAMKLSFHDIEILIQKTKFWDRCRDKQLNERQIKVLQKILDVGVDNFLGDLSTKKYIAITKTSKATAVRDIKELIEYGCIVQVEGTSGRNVRYEVGSLGY